MFDTFKSMSSALSPTESFITISPKKNQKFIWLREGGFFGGVNLGYTILEIYCGFLEVYQGSIRGISWVYQRYIMGLIEVYQGYIRGLSGVYFQRYIMGLLEVYQGYIRGMSWVYQRFIRVSQRFLRGLLEVYQVSF